MSDEKMFYWKKIVFFFSPAIVVDWLLGPEPCMITVYIHQRNQCTFTGSRLNLAEAASSNF